MIELELPQGGINLKETIESIEKQFIEIALDRMSEHRGNAAAILGIKRTTLIEKMKKYGMGLKEPTRPRAAEIVEGL